MHEFNLLLVLSRQDWTPAAECQADALAALATHGLTRVLFVQDGVEAITLTEIGWAEVARIQEKYREGVVMADIPLTAEHADLARKHGDLCEAVAELLAAQDNITDTRGGKGHSQQSIDRAPAVAVRNAALVKLKAVFEVCKPA